MIRSFEDLEVYQRSIDALVRAHKTVLRFPNFEKFGLADQLRRASKSVACNIAEGYGRKRSSRDFKNFLSIAQGSSCEVIVHLEIAKRLGYVTEDDVRDLQDEYRVIGRQLYRLIEKWE